jgi:hypothetical protein
LITGYDDLCQFAEKKLALLFQITVMIQCLHDLAVFLAKEIVSNFLAKYIINLNIGSRRAVI